MMEAFVKNYDAFSHRPTGLVRSPEQNFDKLMKRCNVFRQHNGSCIDNQWWRQKYSDGGGRDFNRRLKVSKIHLLYVILPNFLWQDLKFPQTGGKMRPTVGCVAP